MGLPGINAGTTSDPQVNRTGLTLANLTNSFYIGSINSTNTPLPITLISFTASVVNGEVVLNWTTAAEMNNDYFTVQRSTAVAGWENIIKVQGAGTSDNTNSYSATDPSPNSGVSYYRLMQTDIDGKSTYSYVVAVNLGNKVSEILVYPNPAKDQLWIKFVNPGKYDVTIFNSNGQSVIHPVSVYGINMELNVSELTSGMYILLISHDGMHETRKIMIRK